MLRYTKVPKGSEKNNKSPNCLGDLITRYDYNLTIMKSPKPATDTIYPHIKFVCYRTMLNFYPPFLCRVLAAILKMADILKILKMQNCSSNGVDKFMLRDPKVFRFVVKGVKAIFLGFQRGWGLL
jgi:hypothetical protein